MKLISLFSGIGGFELAAEWMGWTPVVSCEINPFGKKVLEHYWPKAYHHDDIKTLTYEKINEELTQRFGAEWRSDDIILTGGFPCQPYSMAGKRLGKEDERHLWPEMLRIIREVQPTWIVGENVFGLVNWNGGLVFDEVQTDLEAQGYEVQPYVLPACAVNAPHRRDRVWFVAYNSSTRLERSARERIQGRSDGYTNFSNERPTPHPSSERLCGNGAAKQSQFEALGTRNWMGENAPHPDGSGFQTQRAEQQAAGATGGSIQRPITHPNGNGFNGSDSQHEVNASEGGEYAQRNFEQMGRDVADTCHTGLEGGKVGGSIGGSRSQSQQFASRCFCTDWSQFPTQSPVRFGNDGIPTKMDGITFSKWRNESIKAAGNAIVPQVALQIFKAIQFYEK